MSWRIASFSGSWDELRVMSGHEWTWIDTLGSGLHRSATPPAKPSAGMTHVWGWARNRWVRVRVDAALTAGLAGAVLTRADGDGDATGVEAEVRRSSVPAWGERDNRVSMPMDARRLISAERTVLTARWCAGGVVRSLDFLQLGAPTATP